jgi:hypothetical protein
MKMTANSVRAIGVSALSDGNHYDNVRLILAKTAESSAGTSMTIPLPSNPQKAAVSNQIRPAPRSVFSI